MNSTSPRLQSPKNTRCLRILVAEDSPVNQKLTMRLLQKKGHSVVVVENGQLALDAVAREPFDLILMDVQMPVMDGLQAATLIREREKASGIHVPILAMTAHAMAGDRERCLQAGMDAYLSKPIQAQRFYEFIDGLAIGPTDSNSNQQTAVGNEDSIVDEALLRERIGDDDELLRELVEIFRDTGPPLLEQIHQAVAKADASALRNSAHALKGAVSNFAAIAAYEAAAKLEAMGHAGSLSGARELCEVLDREIAVLETKLFSMVGIKEVEI